MIFLLLAACSKPSVTASSTQTFCSFNSDEVSDDRAQTSQPDEKMAKIVKELVSKTGLDQNFEVRVYAKQNVEAKAINNQKFILYNPQFLNKLRETEGLDYAAAEIIAHQIAHHLLGHTSALDKTNRNLELEADRFTGFMMFRVGATLDKAQSGLNSILSKTRPMQIPREERINALEKGWTEAEGLMSEDQDPAGMKTEGESEVWRTVRTATLKSAIYDRFIESFKTDPEKAYAEGRKYMSLPQDDKDIYGQYIRHWMASYEARKK
jgi:hypothetical protein